MIFSKHVYRLELKRNLKGNMIWSFALGLMILLIVAIYPLVRDMMASLVELLESMDPNNPFVQIMNDFGGIPTSGIEYFATEGAMILQLVGGIYAAILGFNVLNKDEKEKTNEILYTLHIQRKAILNAKLLSVLTHLFIFTIIQFGLSTIGFVVIDEAADMDLFWLFGLLNYVLFSVIALISLGLASILKPNQSSFISVAIPFPLYIITTIAQATDEAFLKSLKYLSPFTFAEPVGFFKTRNDFEWFNFIAFAIISILLVIYAHISFQKREII